MTQPGLNPPVSTLFSRQLRALRANLEGGLKLATGLRPGPFELSVWQLFALSLGLFACAAVDATYQAEGPLALSMEGLAQEAGRAYFTLAALAACASLARARRGALAVLIPCLAADLTQWVAWIGAGVLQANVAMPATWALDEVLAGVMLAWSGLILVRVLSLESPAGPVRRWLLGGAYVAALHVLGAALPSSPLLQAPASTGPDPVDVEAAYYAQSGLLAAQLEAVAPSRPGHTDFFFVGFAAFAEEAVFRREVHQVRKIVGEVFGSAGRSIELVNSRRTLATLPLANRPNLDYVLGELRGKMQPDEDILFLFLSSHGTDDGDLVVDFPPLGLNDLTPDQLATVLDASGIRNRVLVVSACYSGAFVGKLANPDTIVITAAAANRNSFGCAHERYWTYFGQAFFADALPRARGLEGAFALATRAIAERERQEGRVESMPQMAAGEGIRKRLQQWALQARE